MRNHLAVQLINARRTGVNHGIEFMAGIVLLALNNVADEYMKEEKVGPFLIDTEKEINRIHQEVLNSVPSGEIDEMAEKIVYHVQKTRKERGMDGSL